MSDKTLKALEKIYNAAKQKAEVCAKNWGESADKVDNARASLNKMKTINHAFAALSFAADAEVVSARAEMHFHPLAPVITHWAKFSRILADKAAFYAKHNAQDNAELSSKTAEDYANRAEREERIDEADVEKIDGLLVWQADDGGWQAVCAANPKLASVSSGAGRNKAIKEAKGNILCNAEAGK